jgi:hypothetical protein
MKARVGDPPVLAYWVYWLNVILVPPTSHDRHSVSSGSSMASMLGQPAAVIDQLKPRHVTRSTTSDVRPGVVPATDLTWVEPYMALRAPLRVETGSLGVLGVGPTRRRPLRAFQPLLRGVHGRLARRRSSFGYDKLLRCATCPGRLTCSHDARPRISSVCRSDVSISSGHGVSCPASGRGATMS